MNMVGKNKIKNTIVIIQEQSEHFGWPDNIAVAACWIICVRVSSVVSFA